MERTGVGPKKDEIQFMGVTPLIIAVRKGFNALVSDLLRGGADAGKLDLIGQSAIDYANQKTRAILNFEAYVEKQPAADNEEEEDAKEDD
jgi:ankyrin repeat protein